LIERKKDRSRQKSSGPLKNHVSKNIPQRASSKHPKSNPHIPKIPIPQPLAHPPLQHSIRVRPPAHNPTQLAHTRQSPSSLSPLRGASCHPTSLIQHPAQQVFRPQDLAHLLPDGQEVAAQGFPDGFVERADGRAAVFARDRGVEVALGVVGGAGVGVGLVRCDVAG
jgi:hypothetical protein